MEEVAFYFLSVKYQEELSTFWCRKNIINIIIRKEGEKKRRPPVRRGSFLLKMVVQDHHVSGLQDSVLEHHGVNEHQIRTSHQTSW